MQLGRPSRPNLWECRKRPTDGSYLVVAHQRRLVRRRSVGGPLFQLRMDVAEEEEGLLSSGSVGTVRAAPPLPSAADQLQFVVHRMERCPIQFQYQHYSLHNQSFIISPQFISHNQWQSKESAEQ